MTPLKTRQQIADEMGISRKTLYRWLKKKNIILPAGLIGQSYQEYIKEVILREVPQNAS